MINIENLSIGDWVKVNIYPTPRRVMRVNMEWSDDGGSVYLMGVARKFGISVIDPVPLTPEILEKNGVALAEDYDENCGLFTCPEFSVVRYGDGYIFEVPQARVRVEHVHELQHAMRLAGINKEIEV